MPLAGLGSLKIYYETYSDDRERTLVLVNGLGSDHREWLYQVPHFKKHFRVVTFDNRGAGVSDSPEGPYTTDDMAGDVAGLMAHLGIERASLLGVSMGGLIVQKFAVTFPELVEKLVLVSTAPGGEVSVKPSPEAMSAFVSFDGDDIEGSVGRMIPYLYSRGFIDRGDPEIDRFVKYAVEKRQNPEGYMAQLAAINSHSSFDMLEGLSGPVLVITGDADRLIPPENSEILAREIQESRLEIIEGGPHRLFAERWREFNDAVLAFLLA